MCALELPAATTIHQVTPLSGPLYVVAGVLAVAGTAKLFTPSATAVALRRLQLSSPLVVARLLGAGEIAVAALAVVTGSPAAWAGVAALYGAFTVFIIWSLRQGDTIASCGCFGQEDTPATPGHAAFNAGAAALAGLAIADPVRLGDLDLSPALTLAFAVLVAVGTGASVLTLTALPRLLRQLSGSTPTVAVSPFSLDRSSPSAP